MNEDAASATVPSQIVFRREQDRTESVPLTYREYVYLVAKGTTETDAARLLEAQLKLVQASLAHLPPGKLVNLAVFDVAYQGKPPALPLATLRWRDWTELSRTPSPAADVSAAANIPAADVSPAAGDEATGADEFPLSLVRTARAEDARGTRDGVAGRDGIAGRDDIAGHDGIAGRDDDLVVELFDAMHELHFLPDAIEAGDFCLGICLEKLGCEAAVVHVYQSDRRDFVVTNARGAGANRLLLRRYPETDAALASVMSQRRPIVVESAAGSDDDLERCVARNGVRRTMLAPVMPVGRFLGAIELLHTTHGRPFTQSDANALAYIAQHFADFIATHGVVTAQDRIRARSERQAAIRSHGPSLAGA